MASTPMLTVLDEDRHWWFATRTRAILVFLDRYVRPGQGRRILDVGCGAANMTHHLQHYGPVVGVDSNPRPLAVARQRGLEAYEGCADALPFEAEEFDVVALLDTVEHVPDQAQVFAECYRVLRTANETQGRPAGKLLVTVPAFMFLWSHNDEVNHHQRRYTAAGLKAELEKAGFRVLRLSYTNFFVFPLAAALIVLRRGRAEPELAAPTADQDAYQVEMEPASSLLNAVLNVVGKVEAALQRHFSLPWGTGVIAIAEKRREA
jgi:SAM-dependent methyltransferase